MNKKTGMILIACALCMFNSCNLTAQTTTFERDAVLTAATVQAFAEHHAALFSDIRNTREGNWLAVPQNNISPREMLNNIAESVPPKSIQAIFRQYGLNPAKGHLQIAVMQYGIVALEIEEALTEVAALERTKREQAADKKVAAYLGELKSQINSADLSLIRAYRTQLRPIFNTGD